MLLENGFLSGVVCWWSLGRRWRKGCWLEGSAGEGVKEHGPPITQPWLVRMTKLKRDMQDRFICNYKDKDQINVLIGISNTNVTPKPSLWSSSTKIKIIVTDTTRTSPAPPWARCERILQLPLATKSRRWHQVLYAFFVQVWRDF